MSNISKQQAIFQEKCPRCREGKVFKYPILHSKFMVMNEYCEKCHQKFDIEPGFYFGAMYISYAFSTALFVGMSLAIFILLGQDTPLWYYIVAIVTSNIVILPFSFRYSRILMLHWFGGVSYRGKNSES
ncbi:MAG: DUF983 domain-containing protein [Cytophagia bacterium]|nr:MAG: DUF983 domain-containing protein [Cytophagales bacterium]TAG06712.1 MAG: DUF983 domain-containing protein [Cytophagia bacterium]TAG41610.1 MAG: DUF983 domain-containing protein [Cytophagia bacterium]TAH30548.1 MAG: DUF983 domain-containing protein [Cytophagales bacterium]